jgi:AraC family transcriptional regulator of adaptative response/methylated-DNA-[protein]-cysteine methyltransferase
MRAAVAGRDKAYDGRFVYAVVTTGGFCRPSCSARAARPENLRFFASNGAARAAGFRPCKRCRPEEVASGVERMVALARHIETHADEALSLASLASRAGLSASRLQRVFKATFGVTPKQYQDAARSERLKDLLKSSGGVADAIFAAGYGSTSRVYGEASRNVGMTPGAYRAGGAGETITYACRDSALGPLLMAAPKRGVCFAQFGKSERALIRQLQQEFPNATLRASTATDAQELDAWVEALNEHLSAGAPRPELPLDLRGTAFQIRVWQFLLHVAEGDVVSYSEVAAGIGKPKAVRAAASACGANSIAELIPCHRVLRSDGGLGGYRWGSERYRALLVAERGRRAAS